MKSILSLVALSICLLSFTIEKNSHPYSTGTIADHHLKIQVFEILQNKCNSCHQLKNKRRVFTLDNMDQNGKKIYNQVFKWKRMPKGNATKLTPKEYDQLNNWITSLNLN